MKKSIIRITLFGLVCLLLSSSPPAMAKSVGGDISDTHKYAWSESVRWQNWHSTNATARVEPTYLTGYVWAENIGWIKLGADSGGPYANSNSTNWGVNKDSATGDLSGYAWSENVGWINFNPSNSQVTIDPTTLKFNGYAWAENVGWVHFQNDSPEYYVMQTGAMQTSAPTVTTQAVSDIGLTTAAGNGNITSLGSPNPTAHGVCWNTGDTPTIVDSHTDEGVATATGAFTTSMTGLFPVTAYYVRAYATNLAGTVYGDDVSFTTEDGTGVPPDVQDDAPNDGDGNGDGTKDSEQTNVTSLPSATPGESYLTVEITGTCNQIENVEAHTYEYVGTSDPGYSYPFGLLGFEIPCSPATVRIYYHGADSLAGFTYRKYGPTPADWETSLWYTMPGATFGTEEIGGETVPYAEFDLTDGQIGDDTGVDGTIYDQGGPAQQGGPAVIPTLNEWGMIILSLLMAVSAFIVIQRRKQA
jgi:hypothetical protein